MANAGTGSVQDRVTDIVQGLLTKRARPPLQSVEQNLTEAGLTSLDMVNLMLAIEDAFEIEIPQRRMTPANFRSVTAIVTLVAAVAVAA